VQAADQPQRLPGEVGPVQVGPRGRGVSP
jgi:hypothetical protein